MSELADFIATALNKYTQVELLAGQVSSDVHESIGLAATYAALRALGLVVPVGGPINQDTIAEAVQQGLLGDLGFKNLFDKEQIQADVKRIALEKAGQIYGYEGGKGVEGLREKIISEVIRQVKEEIEAGAGDYVAAATDSAMALKALAKPKDENWNTPSDLSEKGRKNRERQAKYRASNKRKWVAR